VRILNKFVLKAERVFRNNRLRTRPEECADCEEGNAYVINLADDRDPLKEQVDW
jgi:hypothetical protein